MSKVLADVEATTIRGKRVLVTGGAGFIGSWLCEALVECGGQVLALDNLSSGHLGNLSNLMKKSKFKFRRHDVSTGRIADGKFDYVLHLASRASPDEYQLYPVETLLANSVGTRNALDLALRNNAVMIYASSSEVYGDAELLPTPEGYWGRVNPIGIRSCYDEGKRFGEAICMAYRRQWGADVRIARIFNTYGPRMRTDGPYARVIPRFIRQAVNAEEITVFGDGKQTRSFSYFTDTITGILKFLTSSRAKGEVVNVGNPEEVRIIELARMIKKMTKSDSRIVRAPLPEDDPKRRMPDTSKARVLLGWEPRVRLGVGLKKTIDWFVGTEVRQLDRRSRPTPSYPGDFKLASRLRNGSPGE